MWDVTRQIDITPADAQRINSVIVQHKHIRKGTTTLFFGYAIISVDVIGRLRKKIVEFDDFIETQIRSLLLKSG